MTIVRVTRSRGIEAHCGSVSAWPWWRWSFARSGSACRRMRGKGGKSVMIIMRCLV